MKIWTFGQIAFLVANFATMKMDNLITGLSSLGMECDRNEVMARVKSLGLLRSGKVYASTSNTRQMVIRHLVTHRDLTIRDLMQFTKSRRSGVWKILNNLRAQGNVHVARYDGDVAVWRIGGGEDAEPADGSAAQIGRANKAAKLEVLTPVPFPRPKLGAWGCCW